MATGRNCTAVHMPRSIVVRFLRAACASLAGAGVIWNVSGAAELTRTIEEVKPSIVGIGTFLKVRSPNIQFTGTGFAVADGRHVVTNAHVVAKALDEANREARVVLVSRGGEPSPREAQL